VVAHALSRIRAGLQELGRALRPGQTVALGAARRAAAAGRAWRLIVAHAQAELVAIDLLTGGNLVMIPKKPGMLEHEYLRQALKDGPMVEENLGVNPFKYGMAGGSDTHNSLTAVEEDNFFGKLPAAGPRADRWQEDALKFESGVVKGWEVTASGRTGP
jgi:hypothetical protein